MKKKDKLKYMSLVGKFFMIIRCIRTWYDTTSKDAVVEGPELMKLGADICDALGIEVKIAIPTDETPNEKMSKL